MPDEDDELPCLLDAIGQRDERAARRLIEWLRGQSAPVATGTFFVIFAMSC